MARGALASRAFFVGRPMIDKIKRFLPKLVALPPIMLIAIVGALVGRAIVKADSIERQYRDAARLAVDEKDLEQAQFYYSRLVGAGEKGTDQDQLNWVSILAASGDSAGARMQLEQLAPDDSVGFAAAHLERAKLMMVQLSQNGADAGKLEQIAWHLRHGAREATADNDVLWGQYHLAAQQPDAALSRFESAAAKRPELWFEVAAMHGRLGNAERQQRALTRAEDDAVRRLQASPTDLASRLRLIGILANTNRFEQVQILLRDGIKLHGNTPELRSAVSSLAVMQVSKISGDTDADNQKRLRLLSLAAKSNPNNTRVYELLTSFYEQADSPEKKVIFRDQLESWITSGQAVPESHFALGNLLFREDDLDGAVFHFEAALELDPSLGVVANNLAWVISEDENGDLDRAEQLIGLAMKSNPQNISFADTLAAVLVKQQKYREALPHLEKVLSKASGKKKAEIHQKLAIVYESLDKTSLAERHRKSSQELLVDEAKK